MKIKLTQAPVSAEVGIGPNTTGGFVLTVALAVTLELDEEQAQQFTPSLPILKRS